MTECKPQQLEFEGIGRREIVAEFNGGDITSDGGGLLLREVELRTGIIHQFAACFTDYRDPDSIEHPVEDLLAQRLYGMCLGYEDLNDHDRLRADPAFAVIVGKDDPKGEHRREKRDRGKALAGKSTLNRLELTKKEVSSEERYKKIAIDTDAVDQVMIDVFLQAHHRMPREIILDLVATDDPIHGNQEGRFFHGYYGNYCYLPLYIFCGEFLLGARLRSSNIDASDGALDELKRIVAKIREKWPAGPILIRADSGFCRDEILTWCEGNHVDYVIGLAKNDRLIEQIGTELKHAEEQFHKTGQPARIFKEFFYRTRHSWSRTRRVIGKAEHLAKGSNPRFIVTSLPKQQLPADIYERIYCARGDMENRIKEQQLGLFADRTSAATMRANQLRLYFSAFAYMLMHALRRLGLKGTDLANAQCDTIRLKLLKIGAQMHITVRRIWFRMAGGYPYRETFEVAFANLYRLPLRC